MAKSFLKKNPQKGAGEVLQNSAIRSAGTLAGAFASSQLMSKLTFIKPEWRGMVLLGVGMAGEVLVENETVNTFAQGLTSYGTLRTSGDVLFKNDKAKLGLAGIEDADYEEVGDTKQLGATDTYNWADRLSGMLEEGEEMSGVEEQDEMAGLEEDLSGMEEEDEMAGLEADLM